MASDRVLSAQEQGEPPSWRRIGTRTFDVSVGPWLILWPSPRHTFSVSFSRVQTPVKVLRPESYVLHAISPPPSCTRKRNMLSFHRFPLGGSCPFGEAALLSLYPRHLPPRKHLIFDIPAGIQPPGRPPLWERALAERATPEGARHNNCRAHGCAPTAERTQPAYSSFYRKTANLMME